LAISEHAWKSLNLQQKLNKMGAELFFQDMTYLEPKCPKCKTTIKYGINTKFNNEKQLHICNKCGTELE